MFPPVRNVRRTIEPVAILARVQDIFGRHAARGPDGEIIHTHELADERADRLGLRRDLQPVVERTAFVGFEVTPGDMPQFCGINQRGDGFPQGREHPLESRMKEQRFLVAHEEMIKLHVEVRNGNYRNRGELYLTHRHNGADLDIKYATETLKRIHRVWRRPVHLSARIDDEPILFTFDGEQSTQQHIDDNMEPPAHQL